MTESTGSSGEPLETPELAGIVYEELRELARQLMRSERIGHTLQPTAVVHEAWVRIASAPKREVTDRAAFLRYAARVMRSLLVDHARGLLASKRDGGERHPFDAVLHVIVSEDDPQPIPMLDLDAALDRLGAHDAELARLVELRFLSGLTLEETATALGQTVRQVRRSWDLARAWLLRELRRDDSAAP